MLCRPKLGKLPLALTSFADLKIDQTPEIVAKLIPNPEQKLFPNHFIVPPNGHCNQGVPIFIEVLLIPESAKTYRRQYGLRTSPAMLASRGVRPNRLLIRVGRGRNLANFGHVD
jgi:hypothetical protein